MSVESKKKLYIIRSLQCILAVVIFTFCFVKLSGIIVPKFLYSEETKSPETEMWDSFYGEKENSIDVIFLGNSHVYMGVNPIVFYEKTGLTSFDLSTSSQDIATAYFLLKEALKYQKPAYVVIDSSAFTSETPDSQRTFANMKMSRNKMDAIKEFQYAKSEDIGTISYYLYSIIPFNNFHSRWDSINKLDFDYSDKVVSYNGYERIRDQNGNNTHSNYYLDELPTVYSERTQTYFKLIKELCDENGIEMMACSIPFDRARINDYKCFADYMAIYGVTSYEFNDAASYESIGLNPTEDYRDGDHLNEYGAIKFTNVMADIMFSDKLNSIDHSDEICQIWEEKIAKWNQDTKVRDLKEIERMPEYLEAIKDPDYIVLIDYNEHKWPGNEYIFQDEVRTLLSELGCNITDTERYTSSFSLILDGGNPIYDTCYSYGNDAFECRIEDGHCILAMNRQNYGETDERLNIVVYSKTQGKVIDTCHFDLIQSLNVLRNDK